MDFYKPENEIINFLTSGAIFDISGLSDLFTYLLICNLFTALFNVDHKLITRQIKINLAKTNIT